MKKLISSLVMLVLALFVLIVELVTDCDMSVLVAAGLLTLSGLIWVFIDARNLLKSKKEAKEQ